MQHVEVFLNLTGKAFSLTISVVAVLTEWHAAEQLYIPTAIIYSVVCLALGHNLSNNNSVAKCRLQLFLLPTHSIAMQNKHNDGDQKGLRRQIAIQ